MVGKGGWSLKEIKAQRVKKIVSKEKSKRQNT